MMYIRSTIGSSRVNAISGVERNSQCDGNITNRRGYAIKEGSNSWGRPHHTDNICGANKRRGDEDHDSGIGDRGGVQ
eukprot:7665539-Heterocapsa_arctica.AAC.2